MSFGLTFGFPCSFLLVFLWLLTCFLKRSYLLNKGIMKQSMKNLTNICSKKLEYVILDNILDHSSHWSRQPSLYIRCTVCAGTLFILFLWNYKRQKKNTTQYIIGKMCLLTKSYSANNAAFMHHTMQTDFTYLEYQSMIKAEAGRLKWHYRIWWAAWILNMVTFIIIL